MTITKNRLNKLEKETSRIYSPVENIPLVLWDRGGKIYPETTGEQIDDFYKKTGLKPIIVKLIGYDDNQK